MLALKHIAQLIAAGSCWAFAAMGMLEASLVMNQQADLTVDLSEQQVPRSPPLSSVLRWRRPHMIEEITLSSAGTSLITMCSCDNHTAAV